MTQPARRLGALDVLAGVINERTGLAFSASFAEAAEAHIQGLMQRRGTADPHAYLRLLQHNEGAFAELVAALTVGETYFFREPAQFDFIRSEVLPEIRQRRGPRHPLRIWSAACASGEEAYSLAMMVDQENLAASVHILATDVSLPALERAKAGVYRSWSIRGEAPTGLMGYLRRDGQLFHVEPRLKQMVQFSQLNLKADAYPSLRDGSAGLDLILCRNVLIYFDAATVREVAERFYQALAPGGWLILASSDPMLFDMDLFSQVVTDRGVFYRRSLSSLSPAVKPLPAASLELVPPWPAAAVEALPASAKADEAASLKDLQAWLQQGDYQKVAASTEQRTGELEVALLHVKALANLSPLRGLEAAERLTQRHNLAPAMHFLHALLQIEQALAAGAEEALRRVVFLDRSLALPQFILGRLQRQRGDFAAAARSFRNVQKLCQGLPPGELVALASGETARQLEAAAARELSELPA